MMLVKVKLNNNLNIQCKTKEKGL